MVDSKRTCPYFTDCKGKGNTGKTSSSVKPSSRRHFVEKNCPFFANKQKEQPHYKAQNERFKNLVEVRNRNIHKPTKHIELLQSFTNAIKKISDLRFQIDFKVSFPL